MLEFESVFYKNFMSVGNGGLTIQLNRSPTTLVGGKNGSGKSTLLEAICYCLYGKTLKKITLGGVVNSTNKKALETVVNFKKAGKSYKVVRGDKPKKLEFYIDGDLQDQSAAARDYQTKIEYHLGMDFKLFTQMVILNKERYVPFMEMDASARRKVVEDILDIGVFSVMSEVAKEKGKALTAEINNHKYTRDQLVQKIEGQKRLIAEAESNIGERRDEIQTEINALERSLAESRVEFDMISQACVNEHTIKEDLTKTKKRKGEFEVIASDLSGKLKRIKEKIDFLCNNENCPTCAQPIDVAFRDKVKVESDAEADKVKSGAAQLAMEYKKIVDKNKELETANAELQERLTDLKVTESAIRTTTANISSKVRLLETLVANPKLEEFKGELMTLNTDLEVASDKLALTIEKEEIFKLVKDMLKDEGIKASIVRDYIGFINIRLNEYLNAMNFFLNITLNENFEEKINSINRENFTIDNLSTGQKCRTNLAVWMALLEVSSLKNSAVSNLIFLDEILENLDQDGVQDFMKLVNDKLPHKNVFVVTQRFEEFLDFFRSSLKFKLNDGFTEIVA